MAHFKPTNELQNELIRSIESIIRSWRNTNDISSPTHFGDIWEEMNKYKYDERIEISAVDDIAISLEHILKQIRYIDQC